MSMSGVGGDRLEGVAAFVIQGPSEIPASASVRSKSHPARHGGVRP